MIENYESYLVVIKISIFYNYESISIAKILVFFELNLF